MLTKKKIPNPNPLVNIPFVIVESYCPCARFFLEFWLVGWDSACGTRSDPDKRPPMSVVMFLQLVALSEAVPGIGCQ